jgi:general secretion pathway protein G
MNIPQLASRRQGGFTLMEIIVVFVLIAGLMAFVGPKIWEQMTKAKSKEAQIRMQQLAGNIELYRLEVGKYPENLQALVRQPAGVDKWQGPYAKDTELKDVWGNDYKFTVPGQGRPYDLASLGADGREGGEGENRDIIHSN